MDSVSKGPPAEQINNLLNNPVLQAPPPKAARIEEDAVVPAPAENLAPTAVKHKGPVGKRVAEIEKRFMETTGLTGELGSFPITSDNHLQVKTDKSKSDAHGEVFTPLWLVDAMLERVSPHKIRQRNLTTEDLCAGYGQFSVRLLRYKYHVLGESLEVDRFLGETHLFIELQPNSCFRLLHIFGTGIRLLVGDAAQKGKLPDNAETGIWVWSDVCGKWYDCTKKVQKMYEKHAKGDGTVAEKADRFEADLETLKANIELRKKGRAA